MMCVILPSFAYFSINFMFCKKNEIFHGLHPCSKIFQKNQKKFLTDLVIFIVLRFSLSLLKIIYQFIYHCIALLFRKMVVSHLPCCFNRITKKIGIFDKKCFIMEKLINYACSLKRGRV